MMNKPDLSKQLLEQDGIESSRMNDGENKHMRLLIEKEERKIQMMDVLMFVLKLIAGIIAAGLVVAVLTILFAVLSYQMFSVATGPFISTSMSIIISAVFLGMVLLVVGFFYNRSNRRRQQLYNSRLERIETMIEKLMAEKESK